MRALRRATHLLLWLALALPAWAQVPAPPNNLTGTALRTWLKTNWYDGKHRTLTYDNARRRLYNFIDNQNTGPTANRVTCVYGGYARNWTYAGTGTNPYPINCEHTIPQSFFGKVAPMVSDLHHLFPAYDRWNSLRNNNQFGGFANTPTTIWVRDTTRMDSPPPVADQHLWSKYDNGKFCPRKEHRGNLARAVMYFYTVYPTEAGALADLMNVDTMYAWHLSDPVDATEQQRNSRIESAQGTRNPYIDYPEIAARAWGIVTCAGTPATNTSGLAITAVQPGSFTLSWTNGSADSRLVLVQPGGSVTATLVNGTSYTGNANYASAPAVGSARVVYTGTGSTVTVTGLTAGTAYAIRVVEYCSNGNQYASGGASGTQTTSGCTTPNTPVTAATASPGATTATLSFTPGNGDARLVVLRKDGAVSFTPVAGTSYTANSDFSAATDQGDGNRVVYAGAASSVSVTGLSGNSAYYLRVYEYCSASASYYLTNAAEGTFATDVVCTGAPTQVGSLAVTSSTTGTITLSVGAGNGNARLLITRAGSAVTFTPVNGTTYTASNNFTAGIDVGDGQKVVSVSSASTVTVTGLAPNTAYYFRVHEYCNLTGQYTSLPASSLPTAQVSTKGTSDLLISEYIEGTGNNKAIEIYNGTGAEVDLSEYSIRVFTNGATTGTTIALSGTLDDGLTYLVANPQATFSSQAQQTSGSLNFNSDDAVALFRGSNMIDLVGVIGCQPTTSWEATGGFSTIDKTLRRRSTVCQGITTNPTGTCSRTNFTSLATEWLVFPTDNIADLNNHVNDCAGSTTAIITGTVGTPVCLPAGGTTVSVPFTASGTFFGGNVFTAQLSSATGSFASPSTIGTLTATASGTITATVPGTVASGTGYRIRVVANSPATEGSDNGESLVIAPAAPVVSTITTSGVNTTMTIGWTLPAATCLDDVMVVVRPAALTAAAPAGNSYTANAVYTSGGVFNESDARVVYKALGNSVTVTGLTSSTTYYISIFSRRGTTWSTAVTASHTLLDLSSTIYRSNVTTGNWSAAASWQSSTDGGSSWATATVAPNSTHGTVTVRAGHTITFDAAATIDQVVVENGATLSWSGAIAMTLANGAGDDLSISGRLLYPSTTGSNVPTLNSGATIRFTSTGSLEVTGSTIANVSGFANTRTGNISSSVIWENGSLFHWNTGSAFATAGLTYFPNNTSSAAPIFRVRSITIGAATATVFNCVVDVPSTHTLTLDGTGTKTFRFGLTGAGTVTQAVENQTISFTGPAATLGVATLNLLNGGKLLIASTSLTTITRSIAFSNGGTSTLEVLGGLNLQGFTISTLTSVQAPNGVLYTSNAQGLLGNTSASFGSANSIGVVLYSAVGNTGKVVYNSSGAQLVRNETYNRLELRGAGTKTLGSAITVQDSLVVRESATVNSNQSQLQLIGHFLLTGNASFDLNCLDQLDLYLGTATQTFAGNGSPLYVWSLYCEKTTNNLVFSNLPLQVGNGVNLLFSGSGTCTFGHLNVGGSLLLTGNGYIFNDEVVLSGRNAFEYTFGVYSAQPPQVVIPNLRIAITNSNARYGVFPTTGALTTTVGNLYIDVLGTNQPLKLYGNTLALTGNLFSAVTTTPFSYTSGAGRLAFTGTGTQTASFAGPATIGTLDLSRGSGTVQLDGILTIENDLTGNSRTLNAGSSTLYIAQSFTKTTGFQAGTGTVSFTGSSPQVPAFAYYNLSLAGSGTSTIGNGSSVANRLEMVSGNLTNNGTLTLTGDLAKYGGSIVSNGTLVAAGSSPQTLELTSAIINNLTINNSSATQPAVTTPASYTVAGTLLLQQGTLSLPNTVTQLLSLSGTISGETDTRTVWGRIQKTADVSLGQTESFGNLGVTIQPLGNAMGVTAVVRTTNAALSINGTGSVKRSFVIHPDQNSGLNATATFSFLDEELNDLDKGTLSLYYRSSALSPWQRADNVTVNSANNTVTATGLDHFSEWTIGPDDVVLPVTWGAFTARRLGQGALLQWTTLVEKNNQGFQVERSDDGQTFRAIGWVEGQGTTQQRQSYSFTDGEPGTAYYRLKQIDFDGKSDYSATIRVNNREVQTFSLVNNPASAGQHQLVAVGVTQPVSASLITTTGATLSVSTVPIEQLNTWLQQASAHLPAGVYVLQLITTEGLTRLKMVVR